MKPTTFASTAAGINSAVAETSLVQLAPRALQTGTIILAESQLTTAESMLSKLDFGKISPAEIIQIGHEEEQKIHHMLDSFLSKLDKGKAGKVFELLTQLKKGVDDAKLPEIVAKIQNPGKLGILGTFLGALKSKAAREEAVRKIIGETHDLLTGRTATLKDQMTKLETELQQEMTNLLQELTALEQLKGQYHGSIADMALAAAVAQAFLAKATTFVEQKAADTAANPDVLKQSELQELQGKLEQLKSRALSLEGFFTRLPADQLVIQQIQNAGVSTLQETATTAAQRFASIKSTLIALHGALSVKGVQQLAAKNAQLDDQLTKVRGAVMKDIVTTAATAPGDNRLQQAKQIEAIVAQAAELNQIVVNGRAICEQKFDEARGIFAASREKLSQFSVQSKS